MVSAPVVANAIDNFREVGQLGFMFSSYSMVMIASLLPNPSRRTRHPHRRQTISAVLVCCISLLFSGISWSDAVNVSTVALGEVLVTPVYSAPASVIARNNPRIAAEIDARIQSIEVEVGDRVDAGDTLVHLDCRRYDSALDAAEAELRRASAQRRFADRQLVRARNLKKSKNISDELLDQWRTDLAVSEAELAAREESVRQAALNVGHCTVTAPFDAVIAERLISVGAYATHGTALLRLIETRGQDVAVELRHEQIESFLAARELTFDSNGDRFPLALRALLPAADTVTRTREARLDFTSNAALPGTAGRVIWQGNDPVLPPGYLVRRNGMLGIFAAEQDSARFVPVPPAEEGRPVRVELSPELRLITDGRQRLSDGDAINTLTPESPEQ